MYRQNIKLEDNEQAFKVNVETGDIKELPYRKNNIPENYSRLKYKKFGIQNIDVIKLEKYFSNVEFSIIYKMTLRTEFKTNSLCPLNDDTSIRTLSKEFSISVNSVNKIFSKLFKLGVYAQFSISEDSESKEYWILNPFIFWRGKLVNDSIFEHFKNTDITKLLR